MLFSTSGSAETIDGYFEHGNHVAFQILQAVTPDKFNAQHLPEQRFQNDINTFYRQPQTYDLLLLEAKNPNIEISDKSNANGSCAETNLAPFAPIRVHRQACNGKINSYGDAAKLLIGEYVHHLGKGNEFSDWIKLVVIESWKELNPDEANTLFRFNNRFEPDVAVELKTIANQVYIAPHKERPEIFLFIHGNQVHFDAPKKLGKTVDLHMITTQPIRWDAKNKIYVTEGVWHATGHEHRPHPSGLVEKYPVWLQQKFSIQIQLYNQAQAVKLSYEQPVAVDIKNSRLVMNTVEKSYLRQPGKEVIDELFKKKP